MKAAYRSGLLLLLLNAWAFARLSDAPPIRSFFPLPEKQAQKIREAVGLTAKELPAGLYYSHRNDTGYRLDVEPRRFEKRTKLSFKYLVEEADLLSLYHNSRWHQRGIKKITKDTSTDVNEFEFEVGWYTHRLPRGRSVKELWIVGPYEQWVLLEKKDGGETKSHYFSAIPKAILPVAFGAIEIAEDGSLAYLTTNGRSFDQFTFRDYDFKETPKTRLYATLVKQKVPWGIRERPYLLYSEADSRVAFLGGSSASTRPGNGRAELILIDLNELTADLLHQKVMAPFHVIQDALVTGGAPGTHKVEISPILWEEKELGTPLVKVLADEYVPRFDLGRYLPVDVWKDGRVSGWASLATNGEVVMNYQELPDSTKDQLYEIEMMGKPWEYFNNLRSDLHVSIAIPSLFEKFTQQWNSPRNTWMILTYENGERAYTPIISFLWDVETDRAAYSPYLFQVTKVFAFEKAQFDFSANPPTDKSYPRRDENELLSHLRKQISGTTSAVVFPDFPTANTDSFDTKELNRHIASMTHFKNSMGACAIAGKCRAFVTMPGKVYRALKRARPDLMNDIPVTGIPDIDDPVTRRRITWAYLHYFLRTNQRIPMSPDAFVDYMDYLEEDRARAHENGESDLAFLRNTTERLVSYAKAEKEIVPSVVQNFIASERKVVGHWKLVNTIPTEQLVPEWVSPEGDRKPAMPERYLSAWKTDTARLISNDAFSHAVVLDKQKNGSLALLRADADPELIFADVKVHEVYLHKRGFFFIVEDKDGLKVGFFNMTLNKEDRVGVWDLLASDQFQSRFENSRLKVRPEGETRWRVYGTRGEEDAERNE